MQEKRSFKRFKGELRCLECPTIILDTFRIIKWKINFSFKKHFLGKKIIIVSLQMNRFYSFQEWFCTLTFVLHDSRLLEGLRRCLECSKTNLRHILKKKIKNHFFMKKKFIFHNHLRAKNQAFCWFLHKKILLKPKIAPGTFFQPKPMLLSDPAYKSWP